MASIIETRLAQVQMDIAEEMAKPKRHRSKMLPILFNIKNNLKQWITERSGSKEPK